MYTSDTEKSTATPKERSRAAIAAQTAIVYLWISLFSAMFGIVYEIFSHQVYSSYMLFAFAFPLLGGALPFLAISFLQGKWYPGVIARNLYHSGIAALTVGSIVQGVLEIYGTTNDLIRIYWGGGALLVGLGILVFLWRG